MFHNLNNKEIFVNSHDQEKKYLGNLEERLNFLYTNHEQNNISRSVKYLCG